MRWALLFPVFFVMLAATATAAGKSEPAKVGPLDGKQVESLPPVITPMEAPDATMLVEKIANPGLAETAEKMEDTITAITEWQRLAYEFSGADRAKALQRLAAVQIKAGQKQGAAQTLRTFMKENPQSPGLAKARYQLFMATHDTPAETEALNLIMQQNPRTAWDDAALYTLVYNKALATGHVEETYGMEKAATLQTRMKMLDQQNTARKATATMLGFVPGAGQMFLGKYAEGGLYLMLWALITLAFLSACRHRQYAYSFPLALAMAGLWLNSPGSAAQIAKDMAEAERKAAMPQWAGLQPEEPAEAETAAVAPVPAAVPAADALNQLLAESRAPMVEASPTMEISPTPSPVTSNQ